MRGIDLFKSSFSRSGYIFAGQMSNAFFGLVTAVCLTRFLDVTAYGRYTYVLQMLAFFVFLSLPGMATAVMQSTAKGFEGVLASGTVVRLKTSLLGSFAIIAVVIWRGIAR